MADTTKTSPTSPHQEQLLTCHSPSAVVSCSPHVSPVSCWLKDQIRTSGFSRCQRDPAVPVRWGCLLAGLNRQRWSLLCYYILYRYRCSYVIFRVCCCCCSRECCCFSFSDFQDFQDLLLLSDFQDVWTNNTLHHCHRRPVRKPIQITTTPLMTTWDQRDTYREYVSLFLMSGGAMFFVFCHTTGTAHCTGASMCKVSSSE